MRCFIVCSCIGEVFIDSLEMLLRDQVEILRDDACNLRDVERFARLCPECIGRLPPWSVLSLRQKWGSSVLEDRYDLFLMG